MLLIQQKNSYTRLNSHLSFLFMKKYWLFLGVLCSLISFATPDEIDDTFQTFNPDGVTNANIAANNTVQSVVSTPDGKLLIGGSFTTYK